MFQSVYEEDLPALAREGLGGDSSVALQEGIRELLWVVLKGFLDLPSEDGDSVGAGERGEEFVGFLMTLPDSEGGQGRGLLASLQEVCGLAERVQEACRSGHLRMDDAQMDYMGHILGTPLHIVLDLDPGDSPEAVGGRTAGPNAAEDASYAEILSKVSSIQDVLPGYGAGFLAACLEEYGSNPESVIQHLLEGSLSPYLQSLDTSLERKPRKQPAQEKRSAKPVPPATQRERNRRVDWKSARVLEDRKDFTAAIRAQAIDTQYEFEDEYDDEYDDSYDALGDAGGGRLGGTTQDEREDLLKAKAKKTFWALSGRVYNFPKEGSKEIMAASSEEAGLIAQEEARAEHGMIHGRGAAGSAAPPPVKPAPRGGAGGGKARAGGVGGGGARDRAFRDKNKARFANHSRKDRAAKKQGI